MSVAVEGAFVTGLAFGSSGEELSSWLFDDDPEPDGFFRGEEPPVEAVVVAGADEAPVLSTSGGLRGSPMRLGIGADAAPVFVAFEVLSDDGEGACGAEATVGVVAVCGAGEEAGGGGDAGWLPPGRIPPSKSRLLFLYSMSECLPFARGSVALA